MITSTDNSTAGQTYFLDCSLTGATGPATYQWFDSNGIQLSNTSQLQFSPLLASHAGTYTCRATVWSIVVENSNTVEVICKICYCIYRIYVCCNFFLPSVPAPTGVTVTPPLGMIIAGSFVPLTCTVELSPAVDVPVTMITVWTGPDVTFTPAASVPAVMINLTTYTSVVRVNVANNGSYICQATVDSGGTNSGSIDITFGMYDNFICIPHLNAPLHTCSTILTVILF